ncbi:glycosyltransferase family 4 protein [Enterococcus faecium]
MNKNKMNVLVVSPSKREKGGISTVVNNLAEKSADQKVQYYFYSTWISGHCFIQAIYCLFKMCIFPFFLMTPKYSIIYIHFAHNGSFIRTRWYASISKKMNKKVALHSHSSSFDIYYGESSLKKKKMIQEVFFHNCDKLIVLGKSWYQFYVDIVEVPSKKIEILPNAVKYKPGHEYNSQSNIITMFGRLGERKGTYDLLKVAELFQKKEVNIVFKLYGDGDKDKVQRLLDLRGISNVEIKGWVTKDEKAAAMSESVLNVLPSYNEGLPMAILETMAVGIPNVTTNVGSISEVIHNGVNGYLIEPGNIEQLYRAINNFLANKSIAEKINMSNFAKKRISNEHNIDDYFVKLGKLLQKLCE